MALCEEGCGEKVYGTVADGLRVRGLCKTHFEEWLEESDIMELDEESDESGQLEEESWGAPLVLPESEFI